VKRLGTYPVLRMLFMSYKNDSYAICTSVKIKVKVFC